MDNIKEQKKFKDFTDYLNNISVKEKQAVISIIRALDKIPSKKRKTEIMRKVVKKLFGADDRPENKM